jgi:hypothetical protein
MEAHERPSGKEAPQQRRRALLQELDAVYRQIAQAEKRLLRVERRQAALAERRRQLG